MHLLLLPFRPLLSVTFFVDLTDGFQIGNVVVEDKAKLERTAFVDCEIIAYECDDDKQLLEEPGYLRYVDSVELAAVVQQMHSDS
jgi:hypothetical protein